MDNKVNFLRGTSAEYEAKTKDNDTFYYTTDTKKLYLGKNEIGNGIDPKVIQAHIDNQTIHAKVWRGTQEEYNAIEPKEDDTVYIIKDSDNTLADKLIDDTSTTATDKTWSAKKINENDEVARAAINAHSGNAEIHVTAEEKAAWSTVNYSNPNLLINPDFRINQRGTSTWDYASSLGYCVDCWKINSGSLSDSGLLVKGTAYLVQDLEGDFNNLPLVLSVVQADGKMTHVSFVTGEVEWYYNMTDDDLYIEFGHKTQSNSYVSIHPLTNDVSLKYAKLEIGSTATPFCPPNPATELAKCQRYYQIRSTGDIPAVDLRPSMRATPTVTQLADGNYAYSAEL